MQNFRIPKSAILRIIESLSIDEFGKRHNRNRTRLGETEWLSHMAPDGDEIGIDPETLEICKARITEFFNITPKESQSIAPLSPLEKWVDVIDENLQKSMCSFHFQPAAQYSTEENVELLVKHRADCLFQGAAAVASLLHGRRRLVSMVAPHRLMGFVCTVLAPAIQDINVFDGRGIPPDDLTEKLEFGDVVVATPQLWSYLMRESVRAPDNSMAVSFGEGMTTELAASMRRNGFGVLREFYGSTETGVIAWRDSPGDRFVLFEHWRRDGENLVLKRPDAIGFSVDAMDFLEWDGDHGFNLAGRRDGAIQIGAINVFPDAIAKVIKEHHDVDDCHLKLAGKGQEVNRLVADITLNRHIILTEKKALEIEAWCRARLALYERPHIYHYFVNSSV